MKLIGTIRPDFMKSQMILGKEIQLAMPNGEKRKAQFAIVDLDEIIPSHNFKTFGNSEGYPTTSSGYNVNDRNYTNDKSAQMAVKGYAANLEPERLITTSRTPSGTPIITTDGFVVSGNNRTMSLKLAKDQHPDKYKNYSKYLYEEVEAYGITKNDAADKAIDITSFENPVLVRIDYDFPEYNTLELAKYNKDTKKSERPIDKAIKLSNILSESPKCSNIIADIIGQYERSSDFYRVAIDQKRLAKNLIDCNLLTEQELPAYYDGTTFTNLGKDFLENLLAAIVLDKEGIEAANIPGVKQYRNIIVTSLPVLMKNSSLSEGSLTDDLNSAIVLQAKIKQSDLDFNSYIRQKGMFDQETEPRAMYLNRLLSTGQKNFKASIESYNSSIEDSSKSQGLFGDALTPEDVFKYHIEEKTNYTDRDNIRSVLSKEGIDVDPVKPKVAREAAKARIRIKIKLAQ